MERLVTSGKIMRWGVSNLDVDDMQELEAAGGGACVTDQILYNLTRRGPEHDLLPWLAGRGVVTMAYSPVEQGRLVREPALGEVAAIVGATPAQVAIAWLLSRDGVITIPKASTIAHVIENRAAADLILEPEIVDRLDELFPRPDHPSPL